MQSYSHVQLLKTMLSYELMNYLQLEIDKVPLNSERHNELCVVEQYINDRIKELSK